MKKLFEKESSAKIAMTYFLSSYLIFSRGGIEVLVRNKGLSQISLFWMLLNSLSYSLDFVDIKVLDDGVEEGVEIIEKVDNLQWCALR
jgi:hypothetical protein